MRPVVCTWDVMIRCILLRCDVSQWSQSYGVENQSTQSTQCTVLVVVVEGWKGTDTGAEGGVDPKVTFFIYFLVGGEACKGGR